MLLYAHFVWLAAIRHIDCGADSVEMYRLLLIMMPLTLGAAFLIRMTRPFPEVHGVLRWLALPLAGLILLGAYSVWLSARDVYFLRLAPCYSGDLQAWHYAWAPAQTAIILITVFATARVWRSISDDGELKSSDRTN